MSNKFFDWIDYVNISGANLPSYTDVTASDNDRALGFFGGQGARSNYVNAGLRQANLVVKALMDVLAPNNTSIDFRSNSSAVKTVIQNAMTIYEHRLNISLYGDADYGHTYVGYLPEVTIVNRSSTPITAMSYTYSQWLELIGQRPLLFITRESGMTTDNIKLVVLTGYGTDGSNYRQLNGYKSDPGANSWSTWYGRISVTDTVTAIQLGA